MNRIAVLGLQWGDEGKGKIVDYLASKGQRGNTVIVRFNGGANAGHSVEMSDGRRLKVHQLPAGIFTPGTINVMGNGMVIDIEKLHEEIQYAESIMGEIPGRNLRISGRAHVVCPRHKWKDEELEQSLGLGTTKSGNGPAYADKMYRTGVTLMEAIREFKGANGACYPDLDKISQYISNVPYILDSYAESGKDIIFAGAHGAMLDIDHGNYPFVTSSNCTIGAIGTGAGFSPRKLTDVIGVAKAYSTRIGAGPMPSEIKTPIADYIREKGREYGTTTGRPRRIGWLDMVALKFACMINSVDSLCLTMMDVLSDIEEDIEVVTAYAISPDGGLMNRVPHLMDTVYPVTKSLKPWRGDISNCRHYDELPREAQNYIDFIELETDIPVRMISVGPRRDQIIDRRRRV